MPAYQRESQLPELPMVGRTNTSSWRSDRWSPDRTDRL